MTTTSREFLLADKIIKFEEGLRLVPYFDSLGYPTIGFGHLLGDIGDTLPAIVWTEEQALTDLENKLSQGIEELAENKDTKKAWAALGDDTDRKAVVLSMWYQLGINRLAQFTKFLSAVTSKDFQTAAKEMLDSAAARETPKRWQRQAKAMLSGNIFTTYNI